MANARLLGHELLALAFGAVGAILGQVLGPRRRGGDVSANPEPQNNTRPTVNHPTA